MNTIKKIVSDFVKRAIYGRKAVSRQEYINVMRKSGMRVGSGVHISDPMNFVVDFSRPWLIELGNDITFSDHVTILTHDKCVYGKYPPEKELIEFYPLFLTKEEIKLKYPRCIEFYHLENIELHPVYHGYSDMLEKLEFDTNNA